MGLYVCDDSFRVSFSFINKADTPRLYYALDTDDLTVEQCTSRDLVDYFNMGVQFENVESTNIDTIVEVHAMFEANKLVTIEPMDMMIYMVDEGSLHCFNVYFRGSYFKFWSQRRSFFPDFRNGDEVIFHKIDALIPSISSSHLRSSVRFSMHDLNAVVYVCNVELGSIPSKSCSRRSFLSSLALGV